MPYELQMARHPATPLGTLDEPLNVVAQERTATADATSPTRMWYLQFSSSLMGSAVSLDAAGRDYRAPSFDHLSGKRTTTRSPLPPAPSSSSTVPRCAPAISRTIARPRPAPSPGVPRIR